MCGIVGFLAPKKSKRSKDHFKIISDLLSVDTIRGAHSTGVAVIPIDKTKPKVVFKDTVPGYEFIHAKGFKDLADMMEDPVLVIGHNRFATHGTISQPNAHPFEVEQITLVHNGVVINKDALDSGIKSDVDSHHIAGAIQKNGWEKALPKLDGSAILVWYDSSDHTLHFSRTRSRELHLCNDADGTLWFASEGPMLEWVAERHKLKLKDPMMAPQEFCHYSCPIDKPTDYTKTKFEEFKPHWMQQQEEWWGKQDSSKGQHHSRFPRWSAQDEGGPNLGEGRAGKDHRIPLTSERIGGERSTKDNTAGNQKTSMGRSERFIAAKEHLIYDIKTNKYIPVSEDVASRPGTYEPQGTTKRRRMQTLLHDEGFELDEQVDVQPVSWHPERNNPGLGVISAVFTGWNEPVQFRVYNAREGNWYQRDPFGAIRVVVTAVFDEVGKNGRIKIIASKPWIPRMEEVVYGPARSLIPKDIFEAVAKEGCLYCAGEVSLRDHDRVSWDKEHAGGPLHLICVKCTDELKTQESKASIVKASSSVH